MSIIKVVKISESAFADTHILCEEILESGVSVCGFDTETSIPRNYYSKTTVIQFSIPIKIEKKYGSGIQIVESDFGDHTIYIIPLKYIYNKFNQIPTNLYKILTGAKIIKVGCGIVQDVIEIFRSYKVRLSHYVDMQCIVKSFGATQYSLNSLASKYLGINKSNKELGNYDGDLSTDQILYAANDAFLSLATYMAMTSSIKDVTDLENPSKLFYRQPNEGETHNIGYNEDEPQNTGYNEDKEQNTSYNEDEPQNTGYNEAEPQNTDYNEDEEQNTDYNEDEPQNTGYNNQKPLNEEQNPSKSYRDALTSGNVGSIELNTLDTFELEQFLKKTTILDSKKGATYQKLYKVISNGFVPLNAFSKNTWHVVVAEALSYLVKTGLLYYDTYLKVYSSTLRPITIITRGYELCRGFISNNGITHSALLSSLNNTLPRMEMVVRMIIEYMVNNKYIRMKDGKYYME